MIGRDPRASGEMLEAAVIAGLTSEGVDALRVGVLPTPAVAYLTGAYDADFGVMISASHNPMPDNGIKIFGPGGHKLDDDTEDQIEDLVARRTRVAPGRRRDRSRHRRRGRGRTATCATWARPAPPRLDGLTVVVDCAHGAASSVAPRAYRAAGARVIAINAEPNGLNINDGCGSTHLRFAAAAVSPTAPTSVWRTTGTPTGAWPSTPTVNSSTATPIMVVLALAMQEAGELASDTLVDHRDEQPRAAPGDALRRHRRAHDRRRRPLRPRGIARR